MTEREALKLALSTLDEVRSETFRLMRNGQTLYAEKKVWDTITAIKEALAQPEQHQDWCASLTKMLTSIPPKRAPCNCKPKQEPVAECKTCGKPMQIPADDCLACERKEQEPAAWMYEFYADMGHKGLAFEEQHSAYNTPLYSTPPQRTWVGLTKEDKWEIVQSTERDERNTVMELVEAKLKEKNT